MCIMLFCFFFSRCCTTAPWNFLISRAWFMEYVNTKISFLYINLSTVLLDSTPETFANIWRIKWNWIRSIKFEAVWIHSLSEFSVCCHPEILLPWERDITTSPLYSALRSCGRSYSTYLWDVLVLAWEYSWLLVLPPLVTPRNDVWGTRLKLHTDYVLQPWSGECFWLVKANFPCGTNNQIHHWDLSSDTSSVWNFCAHPQTSFLGETCTSGDNRENQLFSQAIHVSVCAKT